MVLFIYLSTPFQKAARVMYTPTPSLHPVDAHLCKGLLQLLVVADKLVVIPHIKVDLAGKQEWR